MIELFFFFCLGFNEEGVSIIWFMSNWKFGWGCEEKVLVRLCCG